MVNHYLSGRRLDHPIFFDDNIERYSAHIIDVRDENGQPIPFENAIDLWICKAEPYCIITDTQYFITKLRVCEQRLEDLTMELEANAL